MVDSMEFYKILGGLVANIGIPGVLVFFLILGLPARMKESNSQVIQAYERVIKSNTELKNAIDGLRSDVQELYKAWLYNRGYLRDDLRKDGP